MYMYITLVICITLFPSLPLPQQEPIVISDDETDVISLSDNDSEVSQYTNDDTASQATAAEADEDHVEDLPPTQPSPVSTRRRNRDEAFMSMPNTPRVRPRNDGTYNAGIMNGLREEARYVRTAVALADGLQDEAQRTNALANAVCTFDRMTNRVHAPSRPVVLTDDDDSGDEE